MQPRTRSNEKRMLLVALLKDGPVRVFFSPDQMTPDLPEGFRLVAFEGQEVGVVEIGWKLGCPLELNDEGVKTTIPMFPQNLPGALLIPWTAVFMLLACTGETHRW